MIKYIMSFFESTLDYSLIDTMQPTVDKVNQRILDRVKKDMHGKYKDSNRIFNQLNNTEYFSIRLSLKLNLFKLIDKISKFTDVKILNLFIEYYHELIFFTTKKKQSLNYFEVFIYFKMMIHGCKKYEEESYSLSGLLIPHKNLYYNGHILFNQIFDIPYELNSNDELILFVQLEEMIQLNNFLLELLNFF